MADISSANKFTLTELSEFTHFTIQQINNALQGKSLSQGSLNLPALKHIASILGITEDYTRDKLSKRISEVLEENTNPEVPIVAQTNKLEILPIADLIQELHIEYDDIAIRALKKNGITQQEYDLIDAIWNEDFDKVEQLLIQGVNVHVLDDLPLAIAFDYFPYDDKLPELLIKYGANVSSRNNNALRVVNNIEDQNYNAHLIIKLAKLLLNNGADIHTDDDQILLVAIELGYGIYINDFVHYLVNKGANINAQEGQPLILAIKVATEWRDRLLNIDDVEYQQQSKNKYDVIAYLLEQGANVNVPNGEPLNDAIHYALYDELDDESIVQLLLDYGAEVGIHHIASALMAYDIASALMAYDNAKTPQQIEKMNNVLKILLEKLPDID